MSLEIILDVLLSAVVLYVYHSDCKSFSPLQMQEFALVAVAAEGYDYSCIAVVPAEPEWVLDAEDYDCTAIVGKLIDGNTGKPLTTATVPLYTPEALASQTTKELRLQAKADGIKNVSRMSKQQLIEAILGCCWCE